MADFRNQQLKDLAEQFKEKPHIQALVEVIAQELQEVWDFLEELKTGRSVETAVGQQLDGIGDIVVMNRVEAGLLTGDPIPVDVLDDDTYRKYLIFKILKNTCDCTYPDIIKAFKMFWDQPLYYSEDPEQPATMIFDTGELDGNIYTTPLFTTPLLRAAGVTLKLYARTKTELDTAPVKIASGLGYATTSTMLPTLEREIDYGTRLRIGEGFGTVSSSTAPSVERKISYAAKVDSGSVVYSVTETPIGPAALQE